MKIATFRLHTASLLDAMRSTGYAWSSKAWCSAGISCFSIALIGAFRSFPFLLSDLLPRRSAVARLSCRYVFHRGHPRFWNFYSTIPFDVVRGKSYMNCLFGSARVVIRVKITKLYFEFVPEWLVSGVVGMLWNGGGLVRASRMSQSCSLILSYIGLPVAPMYTLLHSQGIL